MKKILKISILALLFLYIVVSIAKFFVEKKQDQVEKSQLLLNEKVYDRFNINRKIAYSIGTDEKDVCINLYIENLGNSEIRYILRADEDKLAEGILKARSSKTITLPATRLPGGMFRSKLVVNCDNERDERVSAYLRAAIVPGKI